MSTENKYFTPDIEDIRVGYECEEGSWDSKEDKRIWHKYIWPGDRAPDDMEYYAFQTPYLTKEQIEAEGWGCLGEYPGGAGLFNKGIYELVTSTDYRMKITKVWKSFEGQPDEKTHRKDIYNGGCKDINTFRQICKLLEI